MPLNVMPVELLISLAGAVLALGVLAWLMKTETDSDFRQMLMIMTGLAVVNGGCSFALERNTFLFFLLIQIVLTLGALKACCQVSWPRVLLCTALVATLTVSLVFVVKFAKARLAQVNQPVAAQQPAPAAPKVPTNAAPGIPVAAGATPTATVQVAAVAAPTHAIAAAEPTHATAVVETPSGPDPAADWAGARRRLSVGGMVTRGPRRFVMINSVIYALGDSVSIGHAGSNYTWQVGWQTNCAVLQPLRVGPLPVPDRK